MEGAPVAWPYYWAMRFLRGKAGKSYPMRYFLLSSAAASV